MCVCVCVCVVFLSPSVVYDYVLDPLGVECMIVAGTSCCWMLNLVPVGHLLITADQAYTTVVSSANLTMELEPCKGINILHIKSLRDSYYYILVIISCSFNHPFPSFGGGEAGTAE